MRKIRRLDHWVTSGAMTVDARIKDLADQLSDLQRVRTALGKILEIVGDGTVPEPEPKLKEQALTTNGTLDFRKKSPRRKAKRSTVAVQEQIIRALRDVKQGTVIELARKAKVVDSVTRRHLKLLVEQGVVSQTGPLYRWTGK